MFSNAVKRVPKLPDWIKAKPFWRIKHSVLNNSHSRLWGSHKKKIRTRSYPFCLLPVPGPQRSIMSEHASSNYLKASDAHFLTDTNIVIHHCNEMVTAFLLPPTFYTVCWMRRAATWVQSYDCCVCCEQPGCLQLMVT